MDSDEQTTDVVDIAYKVLAYLRENPDAQDTLEGIVEWWLLDRRIKDQTDTVSEALAYLTKRGLVTARIGTDSRAHYAVERGKQKDIEALLKNRSG